MGNRLKNKRIGSNMGSMKKPRWAYLGMNTRTAMETIGLKVRPYKLEESAVGLVKIDTPTTANIIFNKDVYLTTDAANEYKQLLEQHIRTLFDNQKISAIEADTANFLKKCIHNNTITFKRPKYDFFKIEKERFFDYY